MSNGENRNEQFKSLKEIEAFLRETSRPFVNEISLSKSRIKDLYDKVNAIRQEKIQQALNIPEVEEIDEVDEAVSEQTEVETDSAEPVISEPPLEKVLIRPSS